MPGLSKNGLILNTQSYQYLTSKTNALFELKQELMNLSEDEKKTPRHF